MEAIMERRTFIAASLGAIAGCARAPAERGAQLHTASALAFGTQVSVAVVHPERRVAMAAMDEALAAARMVDRLMSIYRPESQVHTLNAYGVLAGPDPHLLAVLAQARALSVLTRGAFDITVQPLWQAYADATQPNRRPLRSDRVKAGALVNWERVQADESGVELGKPGMKITLNGLAQGYAADLALAALRARGIENALVDMGEFAAAGRRLDHLPWALGVEDPRNRRALAATLQLAGRCVATSGDYAAWFTPDFVHHHIFDPATGESPQELASVTVVAPSAMLADGLSTAFMVMGSRKAHALAAKLPGVELMTINKRGIVWKSRAFPTPA
jgi:thiamine biosynthesis lipoprotein